MKAFRKRLTSNDLGLTGTHQAGIHIPKSETELLKILPQLNRERKNPDAWIVCLDKAGTQYKLRLIYYNNRFHSKNGTRDEYRLTHTLKFFRSVQAAPGDEFEITKLANGQYQIGVISLTALPETSTDFPYDALPEKIKLSGWREVH